MESPSISQELDNELQTEVLSPSSSMADTIIKPISRTTVNFVMGKHRMAAAIASLDQQIHFIQEEMEQLESYGEASVVCKEFLSIVESKPDALLPVTKGPSDVKWDRWFQGANGSRRNKRWI
ncbi:guanine nucleotide-binding protein subunit gamma 2-like isoform X1 [Nicotiana tabacum]|uniref:Guanine nucleotide-binding protein subunit gamma 2-like isoform X1 n=1 Tax=Nicotiana tabacum TaxID=4097 RepID=A0A1S4DCA9_TOBAC|nr:PREDICTED: guanine nucleotide-binding protein subunit gamma 2-like isoform X1 [Nicotiana tabacum]